MNDFQENGEVARVQVRCHKSFVKLPDFANMDAGYRCTFREDKLRRARANGYKYLTEAIYDMYYNKGLTFKQVSEILGYTGYSVGQFIRKVGWPTRNSGGLQSSVLNFSQVAELRRLFARETQFEKPKFMAFYRKHSDGYGISVHSIRRIIYNETFFDAEYVSVATKIKQIVKNGVKLNGGRFRE